MNSRLERLRSSLENMGLACLLVTRMENVRYLSGFSGSSAAALITPEDAILITDGRYTEQASREAPGWDIRVHTGPMIGAVASALPSGGPCGFEGTCSFDFHRKLSDAAAGRELEPVDNLVEDLRVIKDEAEVELILAALQCAARAFQETRPLLRRGVTERTAVAELDYRMMLAGADGPAFDTVVASGPNSALPHAPITDREMAEGDLVVVDFGAVKSGYRSDTTRTLLMPGADERGKRIYEAVEGALNAALVALQPGVKASEVDAAARGHIARAGYAESFSHSLGHGVGLETHERPTLSYASTDVLEPGMVFTVEPGIYIEGWGGVRLEEMVLMTGNGHEVLSDIVPRGPAPLV